MSKLAILGGTPVTENILQDSELISRRDLERKFMLEAYESGIWDDWPDNAEHSQAGHFAREWARFNTSVYCALLTNGTHTLQLAMECLGIGVGDEVIVPGLTWQATASTVTDVNAVPVLVDVEPDTLCIDPDKVEAAITPRTRAIIPVHLYHRMANMDRLLTIAKKHNLAIIEDCAHTHGSQWNKRGAGSLGSFGSFSFQSSKTMNCAEGGALLTQDPDLYWKCVSLRSCGREFKPGVAVHSGNYRLTSLQAGILRGQLAAMQHNSDVMDRNGLALDAALREAPGVQALRRDPQITRQCSYNYVFLYDPKEFDGLPVGTFREALSKEVGSEFGTTYAPLNSSDLYRPHTKQRHNLSEDYRKAITPSRWPLPVATNLYANTAVTCSWRLLGCPARRAHLLTEAIAKVHAYRHVLMKELLRLESCVK